MGQSGTGARMGNTNSRVRGPVEADLDKYIINVTLCDGKCQSSDNTEGGFVMEEVELNIEEGDPEGMLDQDVKNDQSPTGTYTSFNELKRETRICGLMNKEMNKDKKEETLVLTGNEIVVKEDTRDEEMKEENTFVKIKKRQRQKMIPQVVTAASITRLMMSMCLLLRFTTPQSWTSRRKIVTLWINQDVRMFLKIFSKRLWQKRTF